MSDRFARWTSVHLKHDGSPYGENSDRILLATITPFINHARRANLIRRCFFIRYHDGRSHIRLRFETGAGGREKRCLDLLRSYCARCTFVENLTCERYQPEFERYGGARGVALAERHFCASSSFCLSLLFELAKESLPVRLTVAAGMNAIMAQCILGTRGALQALAKYAASIDDRYGIEPAPLDIRASDIALVLQLVDSEQDPVRRYRESLVRLRRSIDIVAGMGEFIGIAGRKLSPAEARAHVILSYVHMANNRLGVSVAAEATVARIAAALLSSRTSRS